MSAVDLWAAVKARYSDALLRPLTNYRDRTAVAIDDSVGEAAAQTVISLWPVHVQEEYDPTNLVHVESGSFATLAVLEQRKSTSPKAAQQAWDRAFGAGGILEKVKNTGARGRTEPVHESATPIVNGRREPPWYARERVPPGVLPSAHRHLSDDDGTQG
jgi:hypothetical protein